MRWWRIELFEDREDGVTVSAVDLGVMAQRTKSSRRQTRSLEKQGGQQCGRGVCL